jgi:hypothetical protein
MRGVEPGSNMGAQWSRILPPGWNRQGIRRVGLSCAIVVVLLPVGNMGRSLWSEWAELQAEQFRGRTGRVVGYSDIHVVPSFAARPDDWFVEEGPTTLVWSGWTPGIGHGWFKVGTGELAPKQLEGGFGRDVVRAIDNPLFEVGDGPRWRRLEPEIPVLKYTLNAEEIVCPLVVIESVWAINHGSGDEAVLLTFNPKVRQETAFELFNPIHDGQRLAFGLTGYLLESGPLLYDRGTESFWVTRPEGLTAVAGHFKGTVLPRIQYMKPLPWANCPKSNTGPRLMVGRQPAQPSARSSG